MRILLTAFEPYGAWEENSSWLAMMDVLRDHSPELELTTRRYPIDLPVLKTKLEADLRRSYDGVLHLGQSPGASSIKLETIAVNVAGCVEDSGHEMPPLDTDGPVAFRSKMPVGRWAERLCGEGIPAVVSYHAGTYLCNATMYMSHRWYERGEMDVPVGFVHLPLATEQVAITRLPFPSLPLATLTKALRMILEDLAAWK